MADVDMKSWVRAFESQMKAEFGSRVCFLGLQGSRARGEAHAGSDIDAVAILDKMSLDELARYRAVLERLPHRELACGFISGKEELCWWEPSELLQFYFDTVPVCGTLDFLRPALTPQAAQHAVLSGACSIYHACAGCASRRCLCCAPSIIAKQVCFCAPGASWRLRWRGRRPVCCAARRHLLRAQRALKRRAACC